MVVAGRLGGCVSGGVNLVYSIIGSRNLCILYIFWQQRVYKLQVFIMFISNCIGTKLGGDCLCCQVNVRRAGKSLSVREICT